MTSSSTSSSGRAEDDHMEEEDEVESPFSYVSRILPMYLIPGKDGMNPQFPPRLMKMAKAEFDLPSKYIKAMCNEFVVFDAYYRPKNVGSFGSGAKVRLTENEYGVIKRDGGDGPLTRIYVKDVCIYLHLQELQGTRIPELLAYGSRDALGWPGFFLLVRYYGDALKPDEVSPREFGELLREIHARGIALTSPDAVFDGFPTVVRNGPTLMLGDIPMAASFTKDAQRFRAEFDFLVSLCKKDDED